MLLQASLPLSLFSSVAFATVSSIPQQAEGVITIDGRTFQTWSEYVNSEEFRVRNYRCQTAEPDQSGPVQSLGGGPGDCSINFTNPSDDYAVTEIRRVPVVVHVITNTAGTQGNISDALVQSQIDVMNEDFRAIAGTNGGNGFDTGVEFFLATEDPSGQPTTGITRSANTTWFNDNGNYFNVLNWDPSRYLNIYTNQASGALGYVPFFPQNGNVGSAADRIVVLWSAFGVGAPIGAPFDLGRTATHEAGHYFGLFHTFCGGCGSLADCDSTGDTICDTNRESNPNFGCGPGSVSCGSTDPVDNYMNFSDDFCMERFTEQQSRRMRCTMDFFRPDVWSVAGSDVTNYCVGAPNSASPTGASMSIMGSTSVGAQDLTLLASGAPAAVFGLFFFGPDQVQVPFGNGFRCVGGQTRRVQPLVQVGAMGVAQRVIDWSTGAGQALEALGNAGLGTNLQFWFRDTNGGGAQFNLSDGVNVQLRP